MFDSYFGLSRGGEDRRVHLVSGFRVTGDPTSGWEPEVCADTFPPASIRRSELGVSASGRQTEGAASNQSSNHVRRLCRRPASSPRGSLSAGGHQASSRVVRSPPVRPAVRPCCHVQVVRSSAVDRTTRKMVVSGCRAGDVVHRLHNRIEVGGVGHRSGVHVDHDGDAIVVAQKEVS